MTTPRYDVTGLGNAIVDILARTDDDFLQQQDVVKGSMMLIDEARAEQLYEAMGQTIEISGGSASNTIVGTALMGLNAVYIGKVRNDQLGKSFTHDIRAAGITFETTPLTAGPATARCFVLVTPDGERTMNTFLGAAQLLGPGDVKAELVANSRVTYLEGYLWDPKDAKDAFLKAATIAHNAHRHVALTLSDAFCVDRYREEFLS